MKRVVKIIAIVLVAGFVIIQFFRIDKTNPPIVAAETIEAGTVVPADISEILGRSCVDCHSNNTRYPWYSDVQPSAWFLKDHIDEGRRELNFSVFNTYAAKKKAKKFQEICEQLEQGEMPIPSYVLIHRDAALSDSDRRTLCEWAKGEQAKLVAAGL